MELRPEVVYRNRRRLATLASGGPAWRALLPGTHTTAPRPSLPHRRALGTVAPPGVLTPARDRPGAPEGPRRPARSPDWAVRTGLSSRCRQAPGRHSAAAQRRQPSGPPRPGPRRQDQPPAHPRQPPWGHSRRRTCPPRWRSRPGSPRSRRRLEPERRPHPRLPASRQRQPRRRSPGNLHAHRHKPARLLRTCLHSRGSKRSPAARRRYNRCRPSAARSLPRRPR